MLPNISSLNNIILHAPHIILRRLRFKINITCQTNVTKSGHQLLRRKADAGTGTEARLRFQAVARIDYINISSAHKHLRVFL